MSLAFGPGVLVQCIRDAQDLGGVRYLGVYTCETVSPAPEGSMCAWAEDCQEPVITLSEVQATLTEGQRAWYRERGIDVFAYGFCACAFRVIGGGLTESEVKDARDIGKSIKGRARALEDEATALGPPPVRPDDW